MRSATRDDIRSLTGNPSSTMWMVAPSVGELIVTVRTNGKVTRSARVAEDVRKYVLGNRRGWWAALERATIFHTLLNLCMMSKEGCLLYGNRRVHVCKRLQGSPANDT